MIEPVQFKQGEKITVDPAQLGKALLERLSEISGKKPEENKSEISSEYPCIQHASFGKYNVFDANKNLLTQKPVKKDEAEKILSEILEKNQKNNDSGNDEDNKNHNTNNLDTNQNV